MEVYESEKIAPSTSGSHNIHLQNPTSFSLFTDQRDALIDFTLKDASSGFLRHRRDDLSEEALVRIHQTTGSEDQMQLDIARDIRHQLLLGNYLRNSDRGNTDKLDDSLACYYREDSQIKVDSSKTTGSHRDVIRNRLNSHISPTEQEIVLEENQMKEIVSSLMFQKDVRLGRMQMKEVGNCMGFDPVDKLMFHYEQDSSDAKGSSHIDQRVSIQEDMRLIDTPSVISKNTERERFQLKNVLSSSSEGQLPFMEKNGFSYFSKDYKHVHDKVDQYPFTVVQSQMKVKNKLPSYSVFEDQVGLKKSFDDTPEQSFVRNFGSPSNFNQAQIQGRNASQNLEIEQRFEPSPSPQNLSSYSVEQDNQIRVKEHTHLGHNFLPRNVTEHTNTLPSLTQVPNHVQTICDPSDFDLLHHNSPVKSEPAASFQDYSQFKHVETDQKNKIPFSSLQEKLVMNHLKTFSLHQEQIRAKQTSGLYDDQQPIELKKTPVQSLNEEIPFQKKSVVTSSKSSGWGQLYKNSLSSQSVKIDFSAKNGHTLLENSERNITEERQRVDKASLLSSLPKSVLLDSSHIKSAIASLNEANILHKLRPDKIEFFKNKSFKNIVFGESDSDLNKSRMTLSDSNMQSREGNIEENYSSTSHSTNHCHSSVQKKSEEVAWHCQKDNSQENQLNVALPEEDSPVPEHASVSSPFHPTIINLSDRQSPPKTSLNPHLDTGPPLQTKDSLNHHSVIAQVSSQCKVCSTCQNFYSENGFLIEEDACSLCFLHSMEGMKCVCHRLTTKDVCTCVKKSYPCAFCSETYPTILLLQKHTFSHVASCYNIQSNDCESIPGESEAKKSLQHQCSICNLTFPSDKVLNSHMELHKDSYCKTCNRTFQQFNTVRHSCAARFTCSLCGAGFSSNYNLKIHVLKHSGNLPYKCKECTKSFSKLSELNKHSLVHSGERPYQCVECKANFSNPTNLRNHKSTHSSRKPHICQVCNKSFTRPADVRRHMLIHTGARPHACNVCGLAFADASNMRKHLNTHFKPQHGSDIKTYHCSYCDKTFARPSELKRHFFTHTNTRPYSCHICGLAFTDSSNLKKHIQTHERASEHVCPQCDETFECFSDLEAHVISSHSQNQFDPKVGHTCQTCGISFSRIVDLQDHVLSHGASPTFKCEICSKTFCEELFLERHLLTHTESRPFVCSYSYCFKSFKCLSHLRSHMLIHSGKKTHICFTCNKSFLKKSSLLRHQNIHTRVPEAVVGY